jgi:hypothetical protein
MAMTIKELIEKLIEELEERRAFLKEMHPNPFTRGSLDQLECVLFDLRKCLLNSEN